MDYDLVVVGGGPAGVGAAFSAAKFGLRVAIIERHNMLGGNWTNGYVLSILGIYTYSGKTKIVAA
ncbi:MAG: FAD-dependent oxidoreductase [Thermoplasmata archaeon]